MTSLSKRLVDVQRSILEKLLMGRVSAHRDADNKRQTIVLEDDKTVLAVVPDMGDTDIERIVAANIAYALNQERGTT